MKCASVAVLLMSLILAVSVVHSAPWDKSARIERAFRKYNPDRVESVTGVVETIYEKVPSFGKKGNDASGFHLILKTGNGRIDVHLGPTWYFISLAGTIDRGDAVEILGSMDAEDPAAGVENRMKEMRASEVRRSGVVVLKVRDEAGRPVWKDH